MNTMMCTVAVSGKQNMQKGNNVNLVLKQTVPAVTKRIALHEYMLPDFRTEVQSNVHPTSRSDHTRYLIDRPPSWICSMVKTYWQVE